LWLRP